MCEEKWTHAFFCYGASDCGTFHFSLGVHNHTSIVLVKMGSKYKLRCCDDIPQNKGRHHLSDAMIYVDE